MFSSYHIGFMGLTCFMAILGSKVTSTWSLDKVHKLLIVTMLIMFCFDPMYWFWEVKTYGEMNLATSLPLYICSLYLFMLPVGLLLPKGNVFKQMALANLATVGLLGGIFGMVFNTYVGIYDFFSFVPLRSLIYHLLMIVTSTILWTTGYYKPTSKDRILSLLPLYGLLLVCIKLNGKFGWDYCYTSGGIGTPFAAISGRMPMPMFLLLLYGAGSVILNVIFYRKYFRNNDDDMSKYLYN